MGNSIDMEILKVALVVDYGMGMGLMAVNYGQWRFILKGLSIATHCIPDMPIVYVSMNFLPLEPP